MNNIELEKKILEIVNQTNYFDMVLAMKEFEPEYKKSDFYKITKKPLIEVVRESKIFYALQLKDISRKIQDVLDNLSLDKVEAIIEQIGDVFGKENAEIMQSLEVIKDLNN